MKFCIALIVIISHSLLLPSLAQAKEDWPGMSIFHLQGDWKNHENKTLTLEALSGKPVVAAMVYTSCQYSCPMVTSKVTSVRNALPENLRDKVTYALISFDPKIDTPEVLNKYKEERALGDAWTLLTGSESSVRNLAGVMGVNYKQMEDGGFSHSNVVVLWNENGEIISRIDKLNVDVTPMAEMLEALIQ